MKDFWRHNGGPGHGVAAMAAIGLIGLAVLHLGFGPQSRVETGRSVDVPFSEWTDEQKTAAYRMIQRAEAPGYPVLRLSPPREPNILDLWPE